LKKITDINDNYGKLNPYTLEKKTFRPLKSNGSILKERQNRKIEHENYEIMKRIQSANTFYSNYKYCQFSYQHDEYSKNISQNARRKEGPLPENRSFSMQRPGSRISGGQNIQSATSMYSRKRKNDGKIIMDSTDAWNYHNSNSNMERYYQNEGINPNPYVMENNYINYDQDQDFDDDDVNNIMKERKANKTDVDDRTDNPNYTDEDM